MEKEAFGQFLRRKRAQLGIGLREFSASIKMDPSNFSKYERGVLEPPDDKVLKRIAKGLKIHVHPDNPEWRTLTALAAAERGVIPSDLRRNERLMEYMPAFYQHLRDHELPEGDDPIDVIARALKKVV